MNRIPLISSYSGVVPSLLALCALTLVLATNAAAAGPDSGHPDPVLAGGGYIGPGPELVSVQQALSRQHDDPVSIRGNITRYLGRDDYTFADSSGTVEIKIGPQAWMGQYVTESDTVVIQGEVKKGRSSEVHIRVHQVVKQPD
jgi:uncharacterized protein (TIGR00156 family)